MQVEESPLPRLMEEISSLTAKLHELSIEHYKQVVDARESLSRCASSSVDLEHKLEYATSESMPRLRTSLTSFQELGRKVVQKHKQTLATIDLHSQLVDLLQIPQLMDTCARSGAIEEALELCSFARTLKTRHEAIAASLGNNNTKGVEIVQWVAEEVEQSALAMRRQLLLQLRGPVDLPTCLRLLSFLKRLDAQQRRTTKKDESQLRREFLEARDAYLQMQTLSATERGDPAYQATLKTIQKNREMWFDVVTQYQAIFGTSGNDADTLARWIGSKVNEFLVRLQESLTRFENCGELGTVYELSSSFAASLSRVGADFRPLLPSLFLKRTRELMLSQWSFACGTAKDSFANGDWGESNLTPVAPSTPSTSSNELAPPTATLAFPVVVDLINNILRSFNDLRNFACLNLARDLAADLRAQIDVAVQGLESYHEQVAMHDQVRRKRFETMCELMAMTILPYVSKCFATVFEWKQSPGLLLDVSSLSDRIKKLYPRQQQIVGETPGKPAKPSVNSVLDAGAPTLTHDVSVENENFREPVESQ